MGDGLGVQLPGGKLLRLRQDLSSKQQASCSQTAKRQVEM
jgi:hypothetical protein